MSTAEDFLQFDESHPIDLVEDLASDHDWEFDRVNIDQIALTVEGQWRTYALTLSWSAQDETLRLISTFEMEPPKDRMAQLLDVMNRINDQVWTGCFTYWADQRLMVWRYGLSLAGRQVACFEQIDRMVSAAVLVSERFYPAFQLAAWGDRTPEEAMKVAIAEAYGRA